jgi:hypothetical protein
MSNEQKLAAPTPEQLLHAANEGQKAALRGESFPQSCPFTLERFPGIEQADFEVAKRPLMNAFFSAWKKAIQQ